jgi:hypothetical protein
VYNGVFQRQLTCEFVTDWVQKQVRVQQFLLSQTFKI